MITCCLFGGGLSDYTHLNCGHQVCSVCSARSLTDQRKVGLPFGRCTVHGFGQVLRNTAAGPRISTVTSNWRRRPIQLLASVFLALIGVEEEFVVEEFSWRP